MTAGVAVVGAGGHAKVVIATLQARGVVVVAVYDDSPELAGTTLAGVAVRGPVTRMAQDGVERAVLAVGDNRSRQRLAQTLGAALPGCAFPAVVHPSATVHESVELGEGTLVFAGCVVQPDSSLGRFVILNTVAAVDHDCAVGDFAHLAPGSRLAGGVVLGEGTLLGIGASVLPGCKVGDWSTVGAGGVVVRDVEPGAVAVGVPARPR